MIVMDFYRSIEQDLLQWKQSSHRKPLIIRWARQVGKTTVVKKFGKQYKKFIALNLELEKHKQRFSWNYDIKKVIELIGLEFHLKSSEYKDCLLFIDEIQEAPKAIWLLRYFYEEIPELHVIAAGSLLEHALKEVPALPVGRVEYKYLHPLSFSEFLLALGKEEIEKNLYTIPIPQHLHQILLDYFHQYIIIWGMPEIVDIYRETNDVTSIISTYSSIRTTYKEDIEKYETRKRYKSILRHILDTSPILVDKRVKFQNFGKSQYNSNEVKEMFKSLSMAKIIRIIYPTTNTETPLLADIKKSPRLQFLDTWILNYVLGIHQELLQMKDISSAYKWSIVPHIITQEIIAKGNNEEIHPHFWVREKSQSSAEIDIVRTYKDKIIPIEIKSWATWRLKSLHSFIDRVWHNYGIRIYAGEFNIQKAQTRGKKTFRLMNLPYYLWWKIDEYIAYLIENYS